MKAPIETQRLLVEVADLDARIAGLRHRDRHLPEQETLDELRAERTAAAGGAARARIRLEDVDRARSRLLGDRESLDKRAARADATELGAGSSAGDRRELANEKGAVRRLIEETEQALADLTEERDAAAADVAHHGALLDELDSRIATAEITRLHAMDDLGASLGSTQHRRAELVEKIPAEIFADYESIAAERGAGAGLLAGGRCGACHMELARSAVAEIAASPLDEVVHCPECRAILVRPAGTE